MSSKAKRFIGLQKFRSQKSSPAKPFHSQKLPSAKSFRSHKPTLCEKFLQLRNTSQAHVCHFATQIPILQLRNPSKPHFAAPSTLCEIILQLRNTPLAHECHFAAPHSHFTTAKWPAKWPAKSPLACKITHWLRNGPPPAKSLTVT